MSEQATDQSPSTESSSDLAFTFNGDYKNTEQARPFMPAFLARHAEIEASGKYPYNDSFRGYLGIEAGKGEDTAIYLCQTLKQLDALKIRVAEHLACGWVPLRYPVTRKTRFKSVIQYGWYMGGTGWKEWPDARIFPVPNSTMLGVLPKGKRTVGSLLQGNVLVLQ